MSLLTSLVFVCTYSRIWLIVFSFTNWPCIRKKPVMVVYLISWHFMSVTYLLAIYHETVCVQCHFINIDWKEMGSSLTWVLRWGQKLLSPQVRITSPRNHRPHRGAAAVGHRSPCCDIADVAPAQVSAAIHSTLLAWHGNTGRTTNWHRLWFGNIIINISQNVLHTYHILTRPAGTCVCIRWCGRAFWRLCRTIPAHRPYLSGSWKKDRS